MIPLAALPSPTTLVHGPDSPIVALARACTRIARSDATVLITGETGVGKEVFARLLHESSARATRPLVAVNCGAIPETLLESELFGHARGAFTGATAARRGRIAAANGGTLFLDEIGELPLSLQVKLLRVLQERCYEPVGATESVPADFRLVAATNRDLAAEVEAGRFRRDLYYRLLVCPLEVPPLRTRRADIPHLFAHFWRSRGEARAVDPMVLKLLEEHTWPGNVRELENLVERLSVCAEGTVIRVADLPAHLRPDSVEVAPLAIVPAIPPDRVPEEQEVRAVFGPVDPPPAEPVLVDDAHPVDLPGILRRLEDAYNGIMSAIQKQLKVAPDTDRSTTLAGDINVRSLQDRLQAITSAIAYGQGTRHSLADLGVKTNRDGTLAIDSSALSAAIARDPVAVNAVFAQATTGIAQRVSSIATDYSSVTGLLSTDQASLKQNVSELDDQATKLRARIDAYHAQLVAQYAAMENIVARFKSIGDFLTAQDSANNKK